MNPAPNTVAYEPWIAIKQVDRTTGGGDCVRVVARPDGQTLFFLGDVAGHDARAARCARELDRHVMDLAYASRPGTLLSILNATIEARWASDLFACAICFSVDCLTGEGSIATAGQLPPIVKSAARSSPVDVRGGPPLGVWAGHEYAERPFKLAAGEILVAVTDGITDPLAAGRDLLGLSALGELVDRSPSDPTDVCTVLLSAARHAGLQDDATVLAIAPAVRAIAAPAFTSIDQPRLAA